MMDCERASAQTLTLAAAQSSKQLTNQSHAATAMLTQKVDVLQPKSKRCAILAGQHTSIWSPESVHIRCREVPHTVNAAGTSLATRSGLTKQLHNVQWQREGLRGVWRQCQCHHIALHEHKLPRASLYFSEIEYLATVLSVYVGRVPCLTPPGSLQVSQASGPWIFANEARPRCSAISGGYASCATTIAHRVHSPVMRDHADSTIWKRLRSRSVLGCVSVCAASKPLDAEQAMHRVAVHPKKLTSSACISKLEQECRSQRECQATVRR